MPYLAGHEILVLVDEHDNELGTDTRENCHAGRGRRHRAFTVFLFHDGKMLLQQRSSKKLLWPGAWDVSYTSHVYPGETYQEAATRKGLQELNAKVPQLEDVHSFVYFAPQGNNAENEFCRVLVGEFDGRVKPNPDEMASVRWATFRQVMDELRSHSERFTPWFRLSFEGLLEHPSSKAYREPKDGPS